MLNIINTWAYNSSWSVLSCYIMNYVAFYWGQNFHATWLYFISNLLHINIIIDFEKISFKAQKSPYLYKNASKPMVQNPWWYYLIKGHGSSSWHNISFSAHDPGSWVSSGEFWESWFGGPRSMFSKSLVVQSW